MGVSSLPHWTSSSDRLKEENDNTKECKTDPPLRWNETPNYPHAIGKDGTHYSNPYSHRHLVKGSSDPEIHSSDAHCLSLSSQAMGTLGYSLLVLLNKGSERSGSRMKDLKGSHRKVYHKHNQWSPFRSFRVATNMAWVALFLLIFADTANAGPHKCLLPSSWRGEWFHSGAQSPVVVDETSISHKGDCVRNLKDRYLFKNKHYGCYRCLVIHQKHDNVLQYKETYCDRSNSLVDVCSLLSGDAQLHSMFRLDAEPVPCPFPHTYTFTYNRGHGECAFPKSTVFSCTESWRLLFRYQACPDVQGTESTTEELVCLAEWKEGSNRYLVGKSDHPLATSDEDRYRCFVYDTWDQKNESGFQVAQSGDATCNGLFSVNDGSRTLRLTKVDTSGTSCRFPTWASSTHWHSLDGGTSLHVIRKNSTLKLSGHSVTGGPATLACLTPAVTTLNSATFVTRVIHGCNSGYQCVHLLSRDSHVLEVIMGKVTLQLEEACSSHFFNASSTNFTTFISNAAESRSCPGVGRYEVLPGTNSLPGGGSYPPLGRESMEMPLGACAEELFTALTVGCSSSDTLEIHTSCSSSEYSCHGWWEEAGRQYLVVTPTSRSSKGVRRLCLVLDTGGSGSGALSLASSAQSCSRELTPGMHGRIALNTTSSGGCEALTASGAMSASNRVSPNGIVAVLAINVLGMACLKALSAAYVR